MPMAVRNKQQNSNNSKNTNFGMKFHIRNSDAELVEQINHALHHWCNHSREVRYPQYQPFPHISNQKGYAILLTNIANICLPCKNCLGNKDYSIYDSNGSMVGNHKLESGANSIDVSSLSQGMYIFSITTDYDVTNFKQIIKR